MVAKTLRQLPQFDPESELYQRIECTDLLFAVNDVPNKVSVYLTVMGGKTYTWLRSLLLPQLPQKKKHTRPCGGNPQEALLA